MVSQPRETTVGAAEPSVLVGASASVGEPVPTWSAVVAALLDEVGVTRTEVGAGDFLTILRLLEERGVTSADGPVLGEELDALGELRRLKEAMAVAMRYFVAHARASGRTWADIGRALGTSPQNAQSNYRLLVPTNYDRLIDDALSDYDGPPTLSPGARPLPKVLRNVIDAHRAERPDAPRVILLSGRAGTGKTETAYLMAEALGWPLQLITPFDLLSRGAEDVPVQITSVFNQLLKQDRSVVLLDEMDHFLGHRLKSSVEQSLVTVALLAGLARLHEVERLLVILTTQRRKDEIDVAILRRGRIDELFDMP